MAAIIVDLVRVEPGHLTELACQLDCSVAPRRAGAEVEQAVDGALELERRVWRSLSSLVARQPGLPIFTWVTSSANISLRGAVPGRFISSAKLRMVVNTSMARPSSRGWRAEHRVGWGGFEQGDASLCCDVGAHVMPSIRLIST